MAYSSCLLTILLCVNVVLSAYPGQGVSYKLRKCCLLNQYYNIHTQSCERGPAADGFETAVRDRIIRRNATRISVSTGRLLKCSETDDCPETSLIVNDRTHSLLPNGVLFENFFGHSYGMRQYCLEMVGDTPLNTALVVALCLHETTAIPKCCPKGQYFDTRNYQCLYYTPNAQITGIAEITEKSENLIVPPTFVTEELPVKYTFELQCARDFPRHFHLDRHVFVNECGSICVGGASACYSVRKYCIDNAFDGAAMWPAAFVCADNVTKICCKGEHIDEDYCSCSTLK